MRLIEALQLTQWENTRIFRIIPGAKQTVFAGVMANGVVKIRIATSPEKGKVNGELIWFLSQELSIPQRDIEILSGHTSQNKSIKIHISYGSNTSKTS